MKLRIRDPDGNIVYYSGESQTVVYGSFFLNETAEPGVWNIQLGVYNNGWQWATSSGRIAYFTVEDVNYTLTVNIDGSGSIDKDPDQTEYSYGSEVDLTAIPDDGWSFSHWNGDLSGSDNPDSIFMDSNKTVTAYFTQNQYTLDIDVVGNGSVTIDPDSPFYTYGDVVDLTATAETGWSFYQWTGDLESYENPTSITIDDNKDITAVFAESLYTLTLNIVEEGSGIVKVNNDGPYHYGDIVYLTAIPNEGNSFNNWTGDLSGNDNPESIIMDSDKTVTANFIQDKYNLTINIDGNGYVSKDPYQENYTYATIVNLTATANSGWEFDHWSGNLSGDNISEEINMTGHKEITTHFKEIEDNGGGSSGNNGGSRPRPPAEINNNPVAIAGGPYFGVIEEMIKFDGSESYDLDNDIESYIWDFGDGTTGQGKIVKHNYSIVGEYIVLLEVVDEEGANDVNETIAIIVQPNRPPSDPNITGPFEGLTDIIYFFSIVSFDEDNDTIMYTIDWGDGNIFLSDFLPSGEPLNVIHIWNDQGIFTIDVIATDNKSTSENSTTINIDEPDEPDIPIESNICLVLILILVLLLLLLLLFLSDRKKREEEEKAKYAKKGKKRKK